MPTLLDPIKLGAVTAPNRILIAPLTRARATREAVPTPVMARYYEQRAGAGLFITNPDLPRRIADDLPLHTDQNPKTWYSQGDEGYADYAEAA